MSNIDLSPEALQKRREIAEKASQGEWVVLQENLPGMEAEAGKAIMCSHEDNHSIHEFHIASIAIYGTKKDAEHIALSDPRNVLAMIDRLEFLEKEAEWLADALAEYSVQHEVDASSAAEWREAAQKAIGMRTS